MSLARKLLELIDHPGGRGILELYSTWHAKRATGRNIEILYDGFWMHAIDGIYWADSSSYSYNRLITGKWLRYADNRDMMGRDLWFHQYTPGHGDVIVDIGAGSGTDLPLFSKQVGDKGHVIAIEAHPHTFAMMQTAVKRNNLTNVSCFQKAVVDKPCRLSISDDDKHISNAIGTNGQTGMETSLEVDGCTLKDICDSANVDRIDLLKMNIEGAEKFAVHGMVDLLPKTRVVCIACHDFRAERGDGEEFRTRKAITDFLQDHRFQVTARDSDHRDSVRDHVHGINPDWNKER